jgi:hypothetical protein
MESRSILCGTSRALSRSSDPDEEEEQMNFVTVSKTMMVSCAIAAAAACNSSKGGNINGNADADGTVDRTAADVKRDEPRQQPITVTGCLQQGRGGSYILTRMNEPSQKSVGTSGSPAAVEQEQLRQAANAYRIDPQGDVKLDGMVGKQIRVSGMLADRADLPKPEANGAAAGSRDERATSGAANNDANRRAAGANRIDRADISQGDLAKIDATSASIVKDVCGDQAKSPSSRRSKK